MSSLIRKGISGGVIAVVTTASTLVGLAITETPASAVGCTGVACDNMGPKGNGCFNDDKVLATGAGQLVQLRFSSVCHAMWTYAAQAPYFFDENLELDMQYLKADGTWVPVRTLTTTIEVNGGADWTNALGARTRRFRFRAIRYYWNGQSSTIVDATSWVRGGDH